MAMLPAPKGFGLSAGVGRAPLPTRVPRNPQSPAPKTRVPQPKPPTDLSLAQQQVSAAYDPVLQQIKDAYQQMIAGTGQVYNAGAKQLSDLYGQYGPAAQAAYDRAGQGLAGIQSMLAATQQGQGAAGAADLAHQLGGIDAATVGRVNSQFGSNLQGEALANATKGANNIAMLLSQGAHAGQYGAALPGIGGQIGFQGLERAVGDLNQNQQQELAKLAAEEPGAVQNALGGIQSNRAKTQQLAFENSLKNETLGLNAKKAATSAAQGNARIGIAQQNANTSAQRALDASQRGWANIGIAKQRLITQEKKAQSIQKTRGLSPSTLAGIQAKAEKDAEVFYNGVPAVTRADGSISKQPVYSRTYQDALNALVNRYPALGPSGVLRILNTLYKPGQFGRPGGNVKFKNGNPVFGG